MESEVEQGDKFERLASQFSCEPSDEDVSSERVSQEEWSQDQSQEK